MARYNVYARLQLDPVRASVEQAATAMLQAANMLPDTHTDDPASPDELPRAPR